MSKVVKRTCISSNYAYIFIIYAFLIEYHCLKRGYALRSRLLISLISLDFIARS